MPKDFRKPTAAKAAAKAFSTSAVALLVASSREDGIADHQLVYLHGHPKFSMTINTCYGFSFVPVFPGPVFRVFPSWSVPKFDTAGVLALSFSDLVGSEVLSSMGGACC